MILLFYTVINVIAVFIFKKKQKKLDTLEIIVYWLLGSYLYQNFSALCYMNFKTLFIPENLSYEFTHFLNRIVLVPLLMVVFLNFYIVLNTYSKRLLLTLSFILLFTGLEWAQHFLGILVHVNWHVWWSFAFWLAALLILIGFMKLFRKILYKGGLKS